MKKTLLIVSIITMFSTNLFADENEWKIGAQIQARTELDDRDFTSETRALNFTSMRTRLFVSKTFDNRVGIFGQVQDSRIFGSETSTLSSMANLDIHQAFVTLTDPFDIPVGVKAGRFEMKYGTERIFGAVGWHFVGRSFDGLVLSFDPGINLDIFGVTHSNSQGYIGNAAPASYEDTIPDDDSYSIYGFWANEQLNDNHSIDVFTYYELDRGESNGKDADLAFATIGVNHNGKFGDLSTILEGAFQTGSRGAKDVSAYLVSLIAKYQINTVSVGAGFDMLSGTEPNEALSYNTFSPTFGTNHKFYGYMDYFINVPGNTKNLGLNDIYVMLNWQPNESKFNFDAKFHLFSSAQKDAAGDNSFGNELDLTIKYNFIKGTSIVWGGSMFMPGDLMKKNFTTDLHKKEDTGFWTYIMLTANIN